MMFILTVFVVSNCSTNLTEETITTEEPPFIVEYYSESLERHYGYLLSVIEKNVKKILKETEILKCERDSNELLLTFEKFYECKEYNEIALADLKHYKKNDQITILKIAYFLIECEPYSKTGYDVYWFFAKRLSLTYTNRVELYISVFDAVLLNYKKNITEVRITKIKAEQFYIYTVIKQVQNFFTNNISDDQFY